jgi:hypothetical protein
MSQVDDDRKLNELLEKHHPAPFFKSARVGSNHPAIMVGEDAPADKAQEEFGGLVQWTTGDGKRFIPSASTADKLTPGVYEIQHSQSIGVYFEKIPVLTQGLLRFPHTNSDRIVEEIQKFWERESIFREYGLTYKRGLIMWGPPGSGKSCNVQLLMKDVVERGGVMIKFTHPTLFNEGMRKFREIEPDTPVVVLMEDIDSIIENFSESEVLNILDGINQIERAVFLATTNYPEKLGARIINRPSRFDKRFFIGHPDAESRRLYFRHIIGDEKIAKLNIDLNKWVNDTEEFSIAHLKELFTAVVILGDEYGEAVETLRAMKEEHITSEHDERTRAMGFAGNELMKNAMRRRKYSDG